MYSDYESVLKESGTHSRQVEVLYLDLPFYLSGTKLFYLNQVSKHSISEMLPLCYYRKIMELIRLGSNNGIF